MAWSDKIRLVLSPDHIVFVRLARGVRTRVVAKGVVKVHAGGSGPPWRAALDELAAHVDDLGRRPAEVTVVLSNHFVRYAVVPWSGEASDAPSWETHVRGRLREKYGEPHSEWSIRASRPIAGKSTLACAIDAQFLRTLDELLDARPLRLVSVQPLLMAAFNELGTALGSAGCFLLYERGALWSATYVAGEWHTVDMHALTAAKSAIATVERQCAIARELGANAFFLCVTPTDEGVLDMGNARSLRVLTPARRIGAMFADALLGAAR